MWNKSTIYFLNLIGMQADANVRSVSSSRQTGWLGDTFQRQPKIDGSEDAGFIETESESRGWQILT